MYATIYYEGLKLDKYFSISALIIIFCNYAITKFVKPSNYKFNYKEIKPAHIGRWWYQDLPHSGYLSSEVIIFDFVLIFCLTSTKQIFLLLNILTCN